MEQKLETSAGQQRRRRWFDSSFSTVAILLASLAVVILVVLISSITYEAVSAPDGPALNSKFFSQHYVVNQPKLSGVSYAIVGSIALCVLAGLIALPVGIGTAVFMEEFKPKNRILKFFHWLIQLNVNNLAGVPSVVYGVLGVTAFVYMFGVFGYIQRGDVPNVEVGADYKYQVKTLGIRSNKRKGIKKVEGQYVQIPCTDRSVAQIEITEPVTVTGAGGKTFELNIIPQGEKAPTDPELALKSVRYGAIASRAQFKNFFHLQFPFGKSIIAAGATLALVILPIVIIASQEAIRAVPNGQREASYGLGANKWETVRSVVLPAAIPGIMTGAILAMSRAIGEAAPILVVMGAVKGSPFRSLTDKVDTLPVTIFGWAEHSIEEFRHLAAAAIIVLLLILLAMNSVAIVVRNRAEKRNAGG